MSIHRLTTGALVLVFLASAGCTGIWSRSDPDAELLPAVAQEFSDVPAPMGFKLEDAYSFNVPPNRMFLLQYSGRSERAKLKMFYKNTMKQQGWMETCESTFGDTLFLDFVKETERCAITIKGKKGKIRVTIRSHR